MALYDILFDIAHVGPIDYHMRREKILKLTHQLFLIIACYRKMSMIGEGRSSSKTGGKRCSLLFGRIFAGLSDARF